MLSSKIVPGSGRGHRPADRQCDRRPYAATACRHLAAAGICRFRDTLEPSFQKHVDLDPCEMRSDATMHARAKDEVANILAVEIDVVRPIDRLIVKSKQGQIGRASCRERVCQYRVDLGGRRIMKKKNTRKAPTK